MVTFTWYKYPKEVKKHGNKRILGAASGKDSSNQNGKKSGAQKGHPGHTMEMVPIPDKVQVHKVKQCCQCGVRLTDQAAESVERRQVVDMPPLKLEVTERV
jgi:hypothetical protein